MREAWFMADIDRGRFAEAFRHRLEQIGYSLHQAARQWPQADMAMLSRAARGVTISAGNYLLLCELAGLDPYAFLDRDPRRRVTVKSILRQAVTAGASRETQHETGADHG
jgi:hypothetical protein